MLDFVWHLRGSVNLDGAGSNDLPLDRIEHLLDKQQKRDRERGPNYLAFNDPLWANFFGSNWLAMVIYDRGRFWIEQGFEGRRLRYELRSLHVVLLCTAAAVGAFCLGFAGQGLSGGIKLGVGAFAWLYGMNLLLGLIRVPPAIRDAVVRT